MRQGSSKKTYTDKILFEIMKSNHCDFIMGICFEDHNHKEEVIAALTNQCNVNIIDARQYTLHHRDVISIKKNISTKMAVASKNEKHLNISGDTVRPPFNGYKSLTTINGVPLVFNDGKKNKQIFALLNMNLVNQKKQQELILGLKNTYPHANFWLIGNCQSFIYLLDKIYILNKKGNLEEIDGCC